MNNNYCLKTFAFLLSVSIFSYSGYATDESTTSISVQILNVYDGNPIWVGVLAEEGEDTPIQWSYVDTRNFSVEFSNTSGALSLVVLKRDAMPVIKSLTQGLITDGVTVEFLAGKSVTGRVVSLKVGSPISEGLVKVQFDDKLGIPLPDEDAIFLWELEEDGTFEIQGLPLGEHTVSVLTPGYMPAEQQVVVESEGNPTELHFQLAKAVNIQGRIVDKRYRTLVEGSFEVVVSPPESQTAEVRTEFDDERIFRLGPFAEDAVVELVARSKSELWSRPIEVVAPADDVEISVYQWIRVLGTVQHQETGEPVPEFSVITESIFDEVSEVVDELGQFNVEMSAEDFRMVSIVAEGYSFWSSERINIDQVIDGELDLGIIELEPVYTVQGRVIDRETRKPIEGAEIYRDDSALENDPRSTVIVMWNSWKVKTTTNAAGEFQLDGMPAEGSGIWASAPRYSGEGQTVEDVDVPLEFELEPSSSISGQVVSLTGEPVAAMIHFNGGGKRTNDGNFLFKVRAGTHRYKAFADAGQSKVVEVTVESGEAVEDIRLVIEMIARVHGTISGLLDDETARVWVDGVAGAYKSVLTNGAFEITGIPQGQYIVKSSTNLGRTLADTVVVDDTLEGRVDLIFTGVSSFSGRLLSGMDGLEGYRIKAFPEKTFLPTVGTKTVRDGSFRLEGLVDGNYRVEVPRYSFTQQIVVQGDTYSDIHLSANQLFGQLLGDGSMEGATVYLKGVVADREISVWCKVNSDGHYRFKGVPSGTYTVRIKHEAFDGVVQEIEVDQESIELDLYLDEVPHDYEE